MKVFLSYRRADSQFFAGRVRDAIAARVGDTKVFFDIDSIPLGSDFRDHVRDTVEASDAVLLVIGPSWSTEQLADPADYVRVEVETALASDRLVVPILVGEAAMPRSDQLPASLTQLPFLQAHRIRPDPDFHRDIEELLDRLELALRNTPRDRLTLTRVAPVSTEDAPEIADPIDPAYVPVKPSPHRRKQLLLALAGVVAILAVLVVWAAIGNNRANPSDADRALATTNSADGWTVSVVCVTAEVTCPAQARATTIVDGPQEWADGGRWLAVQSEAPCLPGATPSEARPVRSTYSHAVDLSGLGSRVELRAWWAVDNDFVSIEVGNTKMDLVGTNAYAELVEWKTVLERPEALTEIRITVVGDGCTDGLLIANLHASRISA